MIRNDLHGFDHREPFVIGDFDPDRTFVHVFDDTTLDVIMATLDTTPDFLTYLREKERFLRSQAVVVAGEENLLAYYLGHVDEAGQHAFVVEGSPDLVAIDESWWPHFVKSPERKAQIQHDRVSYAWDRLIEKFATHALDGTQHFATDPPFESSEKILRFMAAESRLRRRYLAQMIVEALEQTETHLRRLRVATSEDPSEPMYVFLLVPWRHDRPYEENRLVRRNFLEASIRVAKFKFRDAVDVVGIATESGLDNEGRSEDALYFDAREWTEEDDRHAQELQGKLGILTAPQMMMTSVTEYPLDSSHTFGQAIPKNPRNKPCPCGSGKKFKRCHGK